MIRPHTFFFYAIETNNFSHLQNKIFSYKLSTGGVYSVDFYVGVLKYLVVSFALLVPYSVSFRSPTQQISLLRSENICSNWSL
jgi:hypothetical protein